jgi:hypothetical protein
MVNSADGKLAHAGASTLVQKRAPPESSGVRS